MKKEKCFDLGTLQAFIDGELASDVTENVIKHIALCDGCVKLLAETEEENAFAFSVLNDELNVLVPTERLRTKVFDSIREIKSKESWLNKIYFNLGFLFKSPSLVAFAGVVLFVCTLAIGLNLFDSKPTTNDLVQVENKMVQPIEVNKPDVVNPNPTDEKSDQVDMVEVPKVQPTDQTEVRVIKTGGIKTEVSNMKPSKADNYEGKIAPKKLNNEVAEPIVSPNLSGEDSYLQTIETLSRTVDNSKDMILRPTERVAFERDLAVVDNAIKKTKEEVRKNPKNQAAREVLRASYQNKIDLLNSVAEKNDLIASIH